MLAAREYVCFSCRQVFGKPARSTEILQYHRPAHAVWLQSPMLAFSKLEVSCVLHGGGNRGRGGSSPAGENRT